MNEASSDEGDSSNQILELGGHFYWNIYSLYEHLKASMVAAAKEEPDRVDRYRHMGPSISPFWSTVRCWACYAYRDPHTWGLPEYFRRSCRAKVYEATGIQVMNFNSLYQLYAMKRDKSSLLAAAKEALFIPDALSYMLTGKKVVEYTIASTSQMLNPRTKKFEKALLEKMGVDPELFGQIVMPGYVIGELTDTLAAETGLGKIPVVAVAGHDTASAVAAVP
ncbi:MAG: FGGY family carbohydrate kinase [Alistipes sp.]